MRRRAPPRWLAAAACAAVLAACASAPQAPAGAEGRLSAPAGAALSPAAPGTALAVGPASAPRAEQPEVASGWTPQALRHFRNFAIASAHPLASQAGAQVLREGGNAVDAAIAAQMVLALVEPQSSGLGGGAFLLLHMDGRTLAYDGRETAPAADDERLFLDAAGRPLPFHEALVGGRAVGVPGAVAMLAQVHREHGRLPWARLLAHAIRLADEGFALSPRLHASLLADGDLRRDPVAAAYFLAPDGSPWPVGHRLRNPELAAALRAIAREGAAGLMRGEFAQAIVHAVRSHPTNPGRMTLQDLRDYRPQRRAPLCFDHRALQRVLRLCGMGPPSSGAITVGQMLGLLAAAEAEAGTAPRIPLADAEATPRPGSGAPPAGATAPASTVAALHRYAEASRLAFADRAQYIADPAFTEPPPGGWDALLAPAYLATRAARIGTARMPSPVPAGEPGAQRSAYAPMAAQPEHGTSHLSVIDGQGNAVAMTTSVEAAFGARIMANRGRGLAGGFLLNNQLTDFSFAPRGDDGRPVANRVQPGKRPRSSMAPTLVLDPATGDVLAATGSAGGPFILHFVTTALRGVLDQGLAPDQALARPWLGTIGGDELYVERGRWPAPTLDALRALGHPVREIGLPSGTQMLLREPGGIAAASDPRREGAAAGE